MYLLTYIYGFGLQFFEFHLLLLRVSLQFTLHAVMRDGVDLITISVLKGLRNVAVCSLFVKSGSVISKIPMSELSST